MRCEEKERTAETDAAYPADGDNFPMTEAGSAEIDIDTTAADERATSGGVGEEGHQEVL